MALEGKVAKILGNNEIVINRGRKEGVRPGMLFEIFAAEGEEVWDPDTGETLGTVEDVKAHGEVTEVKERLAVARLQNTSAPFGAMNIGEMQENLQRIFGQMFGENVQIQGFGSTSGDDPDLESMFGGPLEGAGRGRRPGDTAPLNTSRLPVTFALISACVLVYVGVAYLGQTAYGVPWNVGLLIQPGPVLQRGALIPALVAQGEWWRLITSVFLHSGIAHLGFNMLALYFLGSFTEEAFGRSRFFALYLLSGISGGLAYLYFGAFDRPAVGASGAIFGLLGGVLGYALRQGTFSWQNPLIRQLLILTALNLYFGFSVPNISNTAHIGGLVGGAAFGWLTAPTVYSSKTLRAATPTVILFGAELILLAMWLLL